MSAILSFSSAFLRLVAWRDFDAFAEKRWMNSIISARFCSSFLFLLDCCCSASWLDSYQKV